MAAAASCLLSPATWSGLLRRNHDAYRLTARGFDVYHDLERAATYAFIEPLWPRCCPSTASRPSPTAAQTGSNPSTPAGEGPGRRPAGCSNGRWSAD
jgi:hypothetical protein